MDQKQCDEYHKLAKEEGFDAFITISNRAALPNGLPPLISIDGRRLRSVPVVHASWERLLSEAQLLSQRKAISDPDQHWMLDEWIRYITHPNSKIIEAPHLGDHWNDVLRAARENNLESVPRELTQVVQRWDGFLTKTALRLRGKLGVDVEKKLARVDRKDPEARAKRLHNEATVSGSLGGEFRVPDAAGDLSLEVHLATRTIRYSVQLRPPTEGRPKTRIAWLARQLRDEMVPPDLLVKVQWEQSRLQSQARIQDALLDNSKLMKDRHGHPIPKDSNPKTFLLEWTVSLPKGRGKSTAPVLEGILDYLEEFYRRVVEGLKPYVPAAPQLPDREPTEPVKVSQQASVSTVATEGAERVETRQGESSSLAQNKQESSEHVPESERPKPTFEESK